MIDNSSSNIYLPDDQKGHNGIMIRDERPYNNSIFKAGGLNTNKANSNKT